MIKLQDIAKDIVFDEENHIYKNNQGKVLTSVTKLLGGYKAPFDPTGVIAAVCAKRAGITKKEMQDKWDLGNKQACDYGHNIHSQVEFFLKNKSIKDSPDRDIIEQFSQIEIAGEIHSELRLKSDKYLIAGTCDIANIYNNIVYIHDLKSNKRFTFKSKYNKKFFYPLNHLDESHINIYSLQIIIYTEMVREHGYNCKPGYIFWINPETRKIEKYDVLDLRKEALILLSHFNDIQNF
jgi:hypothetical protein